MLRDAARRAGAGRLLYHLWHAPRATFRKSHSEGVFNLLLARLGRAEMERAAERLNPLPPAPADAHEIYYLTGHRFAYQTAFCAVSLGLRAGKSMRVVVVNDGTLTEAKSNLLRRLLPGLRVILQAEVMDSLEARLPVRRYPELRRRRLVYPHLRKLTDVHAAGEGWKLVLDSDMLFHKKPDLLLDWLTAPDKPFHMLDIADAYGYSTRLLEELTGRELPPRVNVGLCGLKSEAIDWEKIEYWCKQMISREGPKYYMEQALVAMLMADGERTFAPVLSYIVAPSREEALRPSAVLHHYTAESKAWYFRFAWRHVFAESMGG